MAFYEGLGKKIQQTGQGAIDKTKKGAEIARLNTSISGLEKEMSGKFEELGRAYYQKFAAGKGYDPDMGSYFHEIDAQVEQIEEYKAQVRGLKGYRKCPECGQDVNSSAVFCNFCGAKLEPFIEDPVRAGRTCPHCGSLLDDDQLFCMVCGTRVDGAAPAGKQ